MTDSETRTHRQGRPHGTDDDYLRGLEARALSELRRRVPDLQRVRLTDIADAAASLGLKRQVPAATIRRLLAAGLALPQVEAGAVTTRSKTYSSDDAGGVLVACQLMAATEKLTPRAAADAVISFRRRQGAFAGSRALDALLEVALTRFHRHVFGRLLGGVLAALGPADLPPGTVLLVQPISGPGRSGQEWAERRMRQRVRRPGPGFLAMIAETREIVFTPVISERTLEQRSFHGTAVPESDPRYEIVVATQDGASPFVEQNPAVAATTRNLLDSMLAGYERLRSIARARLPQDIVRLEPSADLTLWLATLFAAILALPTKPDSAHALVLNRQLDPRSGKERLRVLAVSDEPPWAEDQPSRIYMQRNQLLSGYATLLNVPLSVDHVEPRLRRHLITQFLEEERVVGATPGAVSVPIPGREESMIGALYVYAPSELLDHALALRSLGALAPVIGELIQRSLDAERSVEHVVHAITSGYVLSDGLAAAMHERLVRLIASDVAAGKRGKGDTRRLAFVVLNAGPDESALLRGSEAWLRDQLTHISPALFLAPWLRRRSHFEARRDLRDLRDAVCGALPNGATLLMIPAILAKDEIDELRSALPGTLNAFESAATEGAEPSTRVNVWLMDERWERLLAAHQGGTLMKELTRIRNEATSAADVLTHTIMSWTKGYQDGEWVAAVESAKAGLSIHPSNPYLLRRAAEFSIFLGDFTGAERFVNALVGDNRSVTSQCLLGDARLGQGDLAASVEAYASAARLNPDHPLPPFSRAFAQLTVATLLRLFAEERAALAGTSNTGREASLVGSNLAKVDAHCKSLCAAAAADFRAARSLFARWSAPGTRPHGGPQEFAIAFGLLQCELASRNPGDALASALAAAATSPRDPLLQRQLIFAHMWRDKDLRGRLLKEHSA